MTVGLLSLTLASGLGVTLTSPVALAAPPVGAPQTAAAAKSAHGPDELSNPKEEKRRALREQALNLVLNGKATPEKRGASTVVKVGQTSAPAGAAGVASADARAAGSQGHRRDQYVELSREATDRIFVVLAEFGDQRHPDYPDQDTDPDTPGPTRFDGPLHNQIPKPDRSQDNSTYWRSDFSRDYFQNLYFGDGEVSVKSYYEKQSSGRYSVSGTVTDWVKVKYNEARYGRSNGYPCDGIVCSNTWNLVQDAVNQWAKDQRAAGRTPAEIRRELRTFDQWDRYDYDGDGDFNEPDGYIYHFQIVHAGGDQANGDPIYGEDAIWSHRWYVQTTPIGAGGPPNAPFGGTQIGRTGLWVGDYTIQPENGGLNVFAHEYGHDLGLPDLYDTSGGGDNPVNWWSLMAQSRVSEKGAEAIGTRAADLGPWEKLQLGWLDYEVTVAGQNRTLWLGPHEYNSRRPQAMVTVLPKKEVTTELVDPYEGEHSWWSGSGDDLNNTMTRSVTLPAGQPAQLSFQANYDIEEGYDYAYVEVDDGSGFVTVPGSITSADENNGITGSTNGEWVPATFDLSAYAGKTVDLRIRYTTDGGVSLAGLFVDAIELTSGGDVVFADGAEEGDNGWTLDGFTAVGNSVTNEYDNYYISSHRDYVSYDRFLRYGPYNFGFGPERPDYVEHFPYQDGLLVWYWDTSYNDNNTNVHPGEGLILPIDSHPAPLYGLNGQPWRCRVQTYDAPFTTEKADSFTLHIDGQPSYIRGRAGVPVFDDSRSYWNATIPACGVKVPDTGTRIEVLDIDGTSVKVRLSDQ